MTQRLTADREAEIRAHWAKQKAEYGFRFFGYEELLAEIDALRAELETFKDYHIDCLKKLQPDGPIWERLAGYQNDLGKLQTENEKLRAVADAAGNLIFANGGHIEATYTTIGELKKALAALDAGKDEK